MSQLPDYSSYDPMQARRTEMQDHQPEEDALDYFHRTLAGLPSGRGGNPNPTTAGEPPRRSAQAADFLTGEPVRPREGWEAPAGRSSLGPFFPAGPSSPLPPQRSPLMGGQPAYAEVPFDEDGDGSDEDAVEEDGSETEEDEEDSDLPGEDDEDEDDEDLQEIPRSPLGMERHMDRPPMQGGLMQQPIGPAVRPARPEPPPSPKLPSPPSTSAAMMLPEARPRDTAETRRETIRNLDTDLRRLKLGTEERSALLEQARNPDVAKALLKIVGPALTLHEASSSDPAEAEELGQEIAAGRDTEIAIQSIRYLHNEQSDGAVLERLRQDANKLQVIEQPLNLVPNPDGTPGKPKPLGRVIAFSIWWFREIPRSSKDQRESRWKEYAGTGLEFLNDVLGRRTMLARENDTPLGLTTGDYLAFELEVDLLGTTEKVYVLSPVSEPRRGEVMAPLPSSPADTQYRFVQGLVDGFSVEGENGEVRRIYDRLTYSPMILSRIRIPAVGRKGDGDGCPADTNAIRQRLEEEGLHLQCSGRFAGGPMWFVEPSWMSIGSGFRALDTDMPQITPGTPEFASRLQALRDRAQREIRSQGIPRHQVLRLMLAGGASNIDLSRVASMLSADNRE